MGDNLQNILIPVNEWVDLYSLSGITPGLSIMVENVGSYDVYLCVQDTQPPTDHDSYNVVQRDNGVRLQNAAGASGAWAFCNSVGGKVSVGLAQQDGFYDPVGSGGVPSINPPNSSNTPLAPGGTFTGQWVDITGLGIGYVSVYSDQASAIDGLIIEQSTDGINADHFDLYTIPALTGKNFAINLHARYIRVRYINGAIAQTIFRLQLKLNIDGLASSHRIKDDITTDDDARLVKSVLSVKANDFEEYKNVGVNNPIHVGHEALYQSDVNIENSNIGNFSGRVIDILDQRFTTITDSTANNPKIIRLEFERSMRTTSIGFATITGDFSNTIIKIGLMGQPDYILLDESADNTKKQNIVSPSQQIIYTSLQLEFHTTDPVSISYLNATKTHTTLTQLQGVDEDGEIIDFGSTHRGNFKVAIQEYGDTPSIDAFDRLRISEPFTIFDSKQLYDKQPLFYDESIGGSATSTHSTVDARTRETVTASATDFVIRQTRQRFNYQPGKSQLILLTFYAPQDTGCIKRVGVFDGTGVNFLTPNNGVFLSVTENNIFLNIAKNGTVTESVQQADWNFDKLDGTGWSRKTLDINSTQILLIDFEWLGVGRVRIGFVIDGLILYAHYFNHANVSTFTSVYMSTPNLPVRYDIQSDGTGGGSLDHICSTIMSEGGVELTGISRSIDTQNVHLDANAADQPYVLLGLRLKSTHLDLTVLPQTMSMISETNDDFRWSLLLNPTYAGTLTYTDIANSGCQRAAGVLANTISVEGVKISSGYAKSAGSIESRIVSNLRIGSLIDGTRDELILAVTPLASNADIQGSLTFRELL